MTARHGKVERRMPEHVKAIHCSPLGLSFLSYATMQTVSCAASINVCAGTDVARGLNFISFCAKRCDADSQRIGQYLTEPRLMLLEAWT